MLFKVTIKRTRLLKNVAYNRIDTLGKLSDDLKAALVSDELKDVKFLIGDQEIKAHKVVLAARSPVFRKMFATKMKESNSNEVVISDISYDTFEEMLFFIYSGNITSDFPTLVMDLFAASHKYQLEDLKKLCGTEISENLSEENAAAVLEFAEIYDCGENIKKEAFSLCKRCVTFIANWSHQTD